VRKAALIYNPASGVARQRRMAKIQAAAEVLQAAGVETQLIATTGPRSAITQARDVAAAGCDAVIACGGDGTINEVAQGILESGMRAALGIIPLGTANALAAELRLPWNSSEAARALLNAQPQRIAVGRLEFCDSQGKTDQRYWLTATSVGVDAELMYTISTLHKGRFGMAAYFVGGLRLLLTHRFAPFEVEFVESESGRRRREIVAYFLLARVANFGKMFRKVAPTAALTRDDATLILFKTRSRITYMSFAAAVLTGARVKIPGVESVAVTEVVADRLKSPESPPASWGSAPISEMRLRAEVDGEVIGTLPARSTIIPDALTMLFPRMAV
jgi:diacylglycerol kinase (ATP)